jgi:hypothetical protein
LPLPQGGGPPALRSGGPCWAIFRCPSGAEECRAPGQQIRFWGSVGKRPQWEGPGQDCAGGDGRRFWFLVL